MQLGEIAPEKDLLFLLAERHRSEPLAHPPLAHHLAGQVRGTLQVVAGAGRHVLQAELLGDATTEENRQVVGEELARVGVSVVDRHLLGEPERHAARDDRHLVYRIGSRDQLGDQRVARFVVRRVAPLLDRQHHAAPLAAHHHLVLGKLEVDHLDPVLILARGEQRGLVDQVLEIGAGEARRLARE